MSELEGLRNDGAADLAGAEPRPSLLPFDPRDLVALRVRPAEFARMVGVTKQTVSVWIRDGKVTLGPDGKLDPAKAARDVIKHTDPARLRARVFKQAMAGRDELVARIRELEGTLAGIREAEVGRSKAFHFQFVDEQAIRLAALGDAVVREWSTLVAAFHRGGGEAVDEAFDNLVSRIFYPDPDAAADAPGDNSPRHEDEMP